MSYHLPPLSDRPALPGKGLSQPAVVIDYNRQLMEHVGEVSTRGGWYHPEVTYYRHDNGTYPVLLGDIASGAALRVERLDYETGLTVDPMTLPAAVNLSQVQPDAGTRHRARSMSDDIYYGHNSNW